MFKSTKAKLIFVFIFSLICITITALVIMYKNIDINEDTTDNIDLETSSTNVQQEKEQGIDLDGKYNQNDLKIIEKKASKENIEFEYFQIDGLKNTQIQEKINKEIEDLTLNSYKEKIDIDKVVNISVSAYCTANYSNILSFYVYSWGKIDDDESDEVAVYEKGVTYDLNTGNRLKLNDILVSDVSEDILRKIAYNGFVTNRTDTDLSYNLIVSDYGNIEEDIADFIENYKRDKITEFYVTPSEITIIYDDMEFQTEMQDYADYIVIYNKYVSNDSLYTSNDIGYKNLYVLSDRYSEGTFTYTNYQNESNYLIEITIEDWNENKSDFEQQLISEKKLKIEEEIESFKENALQNPDNFYILNYVIGISYKEDEIDGEFIECTETGNYYEMTKHDFTEVIEPIVKNYYGGIGEGGGIDSILYNFDEQLGIEPQKTTEYYNPETGEKIVI